MLGAVFGDIVGSAYEWHNVKSKEFALVTPLTRFTDDSVMTLANALWLTCDPTHSPERLVECMIELGRRHAHAGYGGGFRRWLVSPDPQPYNSWGNGSAMRVSPVGLYAQSIDEVLELARISASVTHNHPEGIKGAQATALAVFLSRTQGDRPNVRQLIKHEVETRFGYDLSRTLDNIRPSYEFDVSCQGSVPEAIIAYLESDTLEDCVRGAISIGGDSDTIAAIACGIHAAHCDPASEQFMAPFEQYLTPDLQQIQSDFEILLSAMEGRIWSGVPKDFEYWKQFFRNNQTF
ncbi:MAG: ADP-ribosylglycohydrolase family protein [Muribaculaceae bacterium]|nr:ADP-ribosylglycohydrolase family protein [Muribaculaceae bacterium]